MQIAEGKKRNVLAITLGVVAATIGLIAAIGVCRGNFSLCRNGFLEAEVTKLLNDSLLRFPNESF